MGALAQSLGFEGMARVLRSGFISLLGWIAEGGTQWWPTVREDDVPEAPCHNAEDSGSSGR